MCNLLIGSYVVCQGVLAYTPVLDDVAMRRHNASWGGLSSHPEYFDALIGVQDCSLLGRQGNLITHQKRFKVMIVDCQTSQDRFLYPMSKRGLLADINLESLNHQPSYLILRD